MKINLKIYGKWEGRGKPNSKIPTAIGLADEGENRYYLSTGNVIKLACMKISLFNELHSEYVGGLTPEKLAKQIYHNTRSYQASIILDGILEGDKNKIMKNIKNGDNAVDVTTNPPAPAGAQSTTEGEGKVTTKKKTSKKKTSKKKAAKKTPAVKKKTAAKKKASTKKKTTGGRKPSIPDIMEKKVKVLAKDNPKGTEATKARFDLYKNGMAVKDYVKAGGSVRDVNWDVKNGWIKLT